MLASLRDRVHETESSFNKPNYVLDPAGEGEFFFHSIFCIFQVHDVSTRNQPTRFNSSDSSEAIFQPTFSFAKTFDLWFRYYSC